MKQNTPVPLQPSEEMIRAGIESLWESFPGAMGELESQYPDDDEFDEVVQDAIVFLWQAMVSELEG